MNRENFVIEVEQAFLRSKRLLLKKGEEYSEEEGDRLEQFHRVAAASDIEPTEALLGMMMKHVTSIADMTKHPTLYNLKKWREKITDLRNYTFLLDALLKDIGVE